jgi:hypothetical protein
MFQTFSNYITSFYLKIGTYYLLQKIMRKLPIFYHISYTFWVGSGSETF